MTTPGGLFRPYQRLIRIEVKGKIVEVPDSNMLLRSLQYLAPEAIAYGRFCWNEECQYCRITYDLGEGTPKRTALACKLMVSEGMRVHDISTELRYCMRDLQLGNEGCGPKAATENISQTAITMSGDPPPEEPAK